MSVEIDILIRQFDNFSINDKVNRIRHKAISNLLYAKNQTEKEFQNLESQKSHNPKINAETIKQKKDLLDKQIRAIQDRNKELNELKKKYNSSEYMPNWFTDLFKFKYKTVDFHKDTIKQIKDFVFEELNKINFPICYCCYSFWTLENNYEKFYDNGSIRFMKKNNVQDYQLIEDKVKDNTLIIYILNQRCSCGKLENYQTLLKNKNIDENKITEAKPNEKKTDEETKEENKEKTIDIIIYIQKFDPFYIDEEIDYLNNAGWIKEPEKIKKKDYSSFRPVQSSTLYKIKYESIDCTETIEQIKDYIFRYTADVIKLPICKCCLWSIKTENNPDFNNQTFARKINIDYDHIIEHVRNYKNIPLKIDENRLYFYLTSTRDQCGRLDIYLRLYENQKIKKAKKKIEEIKKNEETKKEEKKKENEIQKKEKEKDNIELILKKLTDITFAQERKKTEKEERNKKSNELFKKSVRNVLKEFYTQELNNIVNDFLHQINIDSKTNFSFEKLTKNLIVTFAESENYSNIIKGDLENILNILKNDDLINKIEHFNILIIGQSGAGKSTLLNTVLKANLAEVRKFEACTMQLNSYESEKAKGLRIWDSRGFETLKYNYKDHYKDISSKIKELIKKQNPDEYIHCLWFCIFFADTRIKEIIKETLKLYCNLYRIKNLPMIIIFTQAATLNKANENIEYAKNLIKSMKNENISKNIKVCKVLCIEDFGGEDKIPPYGIHELMEKTYESVKLGMESSFIESLLVKAKDFMKKKYLQKIENVINEFTRDDLEEAPIINNNLNNYNNRFCRNNNINNNHMNNFPQNNFNNNLNYQNNALNNIQLDNCNNNDFMNNFIEYNTPSFEANLKIKYSYDKFVQFLNKFCSSLALNLLDKNNKLLNIAAFTPIINIMNDEIYKLRNIILKLYNEKLPSLIQNLESKFIYLAEQIDYQCKTKNISQIRHQLLAKTYLENSFKPLIESKIYEKISGNLFNAFAETFMDKLLEHFEDIIMNNKIVFDYFEKQGKENTKKCFENIKKNLHYDRDDYEYVKQKFNKKSDINQINNKNNPNNKNIKDDFNLLNNEINNEIENVINSDNEEYLDNTQLYFNINK